MLFYFKSLILCLSCVSTGLALNADYKRQSTNTNPQISQIIDSLDESLHVTLPSILTLLANQQASPTTISTQFTDLENVYSAAASDLHGTSPSSGSTTTAPTNDDLSVEFANIMSETASGLSGVTPARISNSAAIFASLDPIVAQAVGNFSAALPGGITLVHQLLLDVQQFYQAEGMNLTLTALGF